jgi:hypothetical protein
MEKIKAYVDSMVEDCRKVKDEIENYFPVHDFEDFLALKAERYFKNDELLSFFTNIQLNLDDTTREELIEYLTSIKVVRTHIRLKNNPINFSTNPMTNMVRLWRFEVYAEVIKHIDIMLVRYMNYTNN